MKKLSLTIISSLVLMSLLLTLFACGGNAKDDVNDSGSETSVAVTVDDIRSAVSDATKFSEKLTQIDADIASLIYPCEDPEEIYAYCGSAEIAEALVIVKSSSGDIVDGFEAYRDKQIGIFEKYDEDEVKKLTEAFIGKVGDYVVYCVSPDGGAVHAALSALTN